MFQIQGNKRDVLERHVFGLRTIIQKSIKNAMKKKKVSDKCLKLLWEMEDVASPFYFERILRLRPEEMMPFYVKLASIHPIYDENNGNSIYQDCNGNYQLDTESELSAILQQCFDYQTFSKKSADGSWDAYQLCEALEVNVCPYCNREFIYTVFGDDHIKVVRPELDHYLPKSRFPMFALSFYNLIPGCHSCNSSIKGQRELNMKKHLHPYIKSEAEMRFKYEELQIRNGKFRMKVGIDYRNDLDDKLKATCEFFHTQEIYQYHESIIDRYLLEAQEFPQTLLKEYKEFINNNMKIAVKRTEKDIFLQKFRVQQAGDEMNEVLIKFRKDIVEQIWEEKYWDI
ncbi:MAG: hypothetical protein K1W23_18545 [Lachnospiraceae bacterium]